LNYDGATTPGTTPGWRDANAEAFQLVVMQPEMSETRMEWAFAHSQKRMEKRGLIFHYQKPWDICPHEPLTGGAPA
jgi:hypothetical protein